MTAMAVQYFRLLGRFVVTHSAILLLFFFAFLLLSFGVQELASAGKTSEQLVYFAEKILLAYEGAPPRLQNFGTIYPPLGFLVTLVTGNAFLAQSLAGSIIVVWILVYLRNNAPTKGVFLAVLLVSVFSASGLYLLLQRYDQLLFFAILSLTVHYIRRSLETSEPIALFIFGLLYAVTFFLDLRTLLLLPFFLLLYLGFIFQDRRQVLQNILVAVFPILFFIASWLYLSWLVTGDPFLPFREGVAVSGFFERALSPGFGVSRWEQMAEDGMKLVSVLAAVPHYFILPFLFRIDGVKKTLFYHLAYAMPLVYCLLGILTGTIEPSFKYTTLFTFQFLFSFPMVKMRSTGFKRVAVASLVGLVLSFAIPLLEPESKGYAEIRSLLLLDRTDRYAEYRELSQFLIRQRGVVLADDGPFYKLVYMTGNPLRFVLPYQYEFYSALANPSRYVSFILMHDDMYKDQVAKAYRDISPEGFYLMKRYEKFSLYARGL